MNKIGRMTQKMLFAKTLGERKTSFAYPPTKKARIVKPEPSKILVELEGIDKSSGGKIWTLPAAQRPKGAAQDVPVSAHGLLNAMSGMATVGVEILELFALRST